MNGETLMAEKAVALYEQHLADNFSERDIRHCLRDKDLACWCALDEPCHADVLLVNQVEEWDDRGTLNRFAP